MTHPAHQRFIAHAVMTAINIHCVQCRSQYVTKVASTFNAGKNFHFQRTAHPAPRGISYPRTALGHHKVGSNAIVCTCLDAVASHQASADPNYVASFTFFVVGAGHVVLSYKELRAYVQCFWCYIGDIRGIEQFRTNLIMDSVISYAFWV